MMLSKYLVAQIVSNVWKSSSLTSILLLFYIREIVSPKNSNYTWLACNEKTIDSLYSNYVPDLGRTVSRNINRSLKVHYLQRSAVKSQDFVEAAQLNVGVLGIHRTWNNYDGVTGNSGIHRVNVRQYLYLNAFLRRLRIRSSKDFQRIDEFNYAIPPLAVAALRQQLAVDIIKSRKLSRIFEGLCRIHQV